MKKYKKFLLEKENRKIEAAVKLSSDTLNKITKIAEKLADKYPSINKIIVFGSATNNSMNKLSDVDIYVDTIKPDQYWGLMSDFSKQAGRDIDLVTPEDDPYFTNLILKN